MTAVAIEPVAFILTIAFSATVVIGICEWLKWAPVNITITMNNYDDVKRVERLDGDE